MVHLPCHGLVQRKEVSDLVTLYNVIDTRTNQFHSIAIVKERNVKWFIPVIIGESEEGDEPKEIEE